MIEILPPTFASSKHPSLQNQPSLIFHAKESWFESLCEGKFDFVEKIAAKAAQMGHQTYAVPYDSPVSQTLCTADHAHIFLGKTKRITRPALYAIPSYIWGFWYLDPLGVNWDSSLENADFVPDDTDAAKARYFFNGVTGHMLRENISKFSQAPQTTEPLPPARAVIFLQEIDSYATPVHFLDSQQMIATVAKSTTARVYVKLHPAQSEVMANRYRSICRRFDNVVVSEESIHALTAASDVVVTQNSAAGFEALMQKKPVILCARSDYGHIATIAKTPQELRKALRNADHPHPKSAYEKYLYWFLGQNMLEPQAPDFEARAWARIAPLLPQG